MEIRCGGSAMGGTNATVTMSSGDHLSVGYKDPVGRWNTFVISAQHMIFLATHEQSEACMLIRPSAGVQYVPPSK